MGRTKRKRLQKSTKTKNIDGDPKIVALKQWMKHHHWTNTNKLVLKLFDGTGRGVCSTKTTKKGTTLVEIPWNLMITITTLENSNLHTLLCLDGRLKMQELLTIYLITEKNHLEESFWKPYIDSLPEKPPPLLWLCSKKEIDLLPEELKLLAEKRRLDFLDSWKSVRKSINPSRCCYYCNSCVLNIDSFTWAYSMVNTRAVYVDPSLSGMDKKNLHPHLSDEPRMALCPFLDMFNHSFEARTEVTVKKVNDFWFYDLNTLISHRKHEQIFISYGPHDNSKLLLEYGFFIPGNKLDCVKFTLEEIIAGLHKNNQKTLDKTTYKFLKQRNFDKDLYVSSDGNSFNLNGLFFVILNENKQKDWCECIFGEKYSKCDLQRIGQLTHVVLQNKYEYCKKILDELSSFCDGASESFGIAVNFWKYWTEFVQNLCEVYRKKLTENKQF